MEGFNVQTLEDTLGTADIYVTATGNKDIITLEHMEMMKDQAIVCISVTSITRYRSIGSMPAGL